MTARTVDLHTPDRVGATTGRWAAQWVPEDVGPSGEGEDPDADPGGDLLVLLTVCEVETVVLRVHLQHSPETDEALIECAAQEVQRLAEGWALAWRSWRRT